MAEKINSQVTPSVAAAEPPPEQLYKIALRKIYLVNQWGSSKEDAVARLQSENNLLEYEIIDVDIA